MRRVGLVALAAVLIAGCGGAAATSTPTPPHVVVPKVTGMQAKRAGTVLKDKGFQPRFVGLTPGSPDLRDAPDCVGPPRVGPIAQQDPLSGSRGSAGSVVALRTGCAKRSALSQCPDHELRLGAGADGGLGHSWEDVSLDHVSGSPCLIDGDLTLSIERDGNPLPVLANNPSTIHIEKRMGFAAELDFNWPEGGCPKRPIGQVTYVLRFGSVTVSEDGHLNCNPSDSTPPGLGGGAEVLLTSNATTTHAYEDALKRSSR